MPNRTITCGDCIHADICKQVNGGWFSRENIAYCKAFKERTNVVEVVRCKDCKHGMKSHLQPRHAKNYLCRHSWEGEYHEPDHFCSYGERKDNG